jgi:outer membrane receptor protein involved in Fe transport
MTHCKVRFVGFRLLLSVLAFIAGTGAVQAQADSLGRIVEIDGAQPPVGGDSQASATPTRLAQVEDVGVSPQTRAVDSASSAGARQKEAGALDEIVVSAQKRDEKLSKVPISISAYTGDQLQQTGATNMADISRATPGFNVVPGATIGGGSNLSIRGISTVQGAATIGIYIDDTPVQGRANNWTQPADPGLFDMQRVEVLRGPQGTLYGASSEGGTVRYISTAPSLTGWSGHSIGEFSDNKRGGLGYEAGFAGGGPLVADKIGLRVAIDIRQDGGYIDQISRATGLAVDKNINARQNVTARVATTFAPTQSLTIIPSFYYQRLHGDDDGLIWSTNGIWPTTGLYQSREQLLTPYTDESKSPSLKIVYDFGAAQLTSVSAMVMRNLARVDDYSGVAAYQIFRKNTPAFLLFDPGYASPQSTDTTQRNFTQEIRLSTTDQTARFFGTVGAFYSHAEQKLTQIEWAGTNSQYPASVYLLPAGPLVPGQAFNIYVPGGPLSPGGILADKYQDEIDQQIAGFVDGSWNVSSKLRLNAGVRVAPQRYTFQYIGNGYFQGGPQILPRTSTKSLAVNPKFTASYQVTDADLVYVSAAKGQRPGGVNRPIPTSRCAADLAQVGSTPQTYTDDTVWSYELGSKLRFLDNKLSIDGSVFYMDWRNIQQSLSLTNCNFSYVGNFGSAVSKGFDLSAQLTPLRSLQLGVNVGYIDAKLSKNVVGSVNAATGVAPVLATAGSSLSLVPGWTSDVNAEWSHGLPWPDLRGFARLDYQYQGTFKRTPGPGSALYNPITYNGDAYGTLGLRTGVDGGAWRASLFVNNLTNAHPVLFLATESALTGYVNVENTLAPRTFGANLSYKW